MVFRKLLKITSIIIILLLSAKCIDDEIIQIEYPRVKTLDVNNITVSGAKLNAEIIHQGNQEIIEYGFVWNQEENPTIDSSEKRVIADKISTGGFSSQIETTLIEDKKYYVRAYAKNDKYLVYGINVEFLSLGSKAAHIEDFYPKIGNWGDTIVLKGRHFSYLSKNNHVLFKDIISKVISSSDSTITCIVPDGIRDKNVYIYLSVANQQAEAKDKFEFTTPEIASFLPLKGTFNDTIKIYGENFSPILDRNIVSFNGHQGVVTHSTTTSLSIILPTSVNTQWNKVEVSRSSRVGVATELFEVIPPEISEISPKEVYMNSLIKITGDNFNPYSLGDTIIFDNEYGEVIESSKKELTVRIPKGVYSKRSFKIGVKVASQTVYSSSMLTLKDMWIQKNDIPYEKFPRYFATGFSMDDFGYAGLGLGNSFEEANRDFYKYDQKKNIWTQINDFGGDSRYKAASFVINNYAYIGGGQKGSSILDLTKDFWKYDPTTDQWSRIADMPVLSSGAVGLSVGGFGYVCIPEEGNNFWKYDPSMDEWTQLPDLKPIFSGAAGRADAGFVIGSKIYIYASGNSTGLHQLYEFDTNTLQWVRKADMIDSGIRRGVVGISLKEKGYIFDKYHINEYDPLNNTWKVVGDVPGRDRTYGIGFEIDDKAYYGSGKTGGSSASDFWEYDPNYEMGN